MNYRQGINTPIKSYKYYLCITLYIKMWAQKIGRQIYYLEKRFSVCRRVEEVMRIAAAEEGIEFALSEIPPEDSLWLDESGFVSALDKIFG